MVYISLRKLYVYYAPAIYGYLLYVYPVIQGSLYHCDWHIGALLEVKNNNNNIAMENAGVFNASAFDLLNAFGRYSSSSSGISVMLRFNAILLFVMILTLSHSICM